MPELSEYIKKAKEQKSTLGEVMEKRKDAKLQELEEVQIEAMIAEAKKKIGESGGNLQSGQSSSFLNMLLYGKKPEEIKQIIDSLDETAMDKLAYLGAAMNGQQLGAFTQILRRPETNVKETIELINTIVKMNQRPAEPQGGITLQGLAALMKEIREAQAPQTPSTHQTQDPMQVYKAVSEIVRPFQDEARAKAKEAEDLRWRELESKIVNPADYIKSVKEFAKDLGMSSGLDPTIQLKLADMAQVERFETLKIQDAREARAEKRQDEKEGTDRVVDLIKTAVQGPIADLTKSLGGAAATRIASGGRNTSVSQGETTGPPLTQITCPKCSKPFDIITGSAMVLCPNCRTALQLRPQSQQNPPASIPPQETQLSAQASDVQQPTEGPQTTQQPT